MSKSIPLWYPQSDDGRGFFLMPRAISSWERLWCRTGFTTRWKYASFFYSLRNFCSFLASHSLTSPLVLVASVQYIVSGDNLSLCVVVAHHIGLHVEDCQQTSALLMVAITQADYHSFVVVVLAGIEFHYGTFGKKAKKRTTRGNNTKEQKAQKRLFESCLSGATMAGGLCPRLLERIESCMCRRPHRPRRL